MGMIKVSTIHDAKPMISRMIFVCDHCDQIDIIDENDYTTNMEKKCPKCNKLMTLQSAETSEPKIKFKATPLEGYGENRGGDYFDKKE